MSDVQKNVLGEDLEICGIDPVTGYLRDGCCNTDKFDRGSHTVCAVVTKDFLEFSKSRGNEAYQNQKAPYVKLKSTNIKALEKIDLDSLKEFALDIS